MSALRGPGRRFDEVTQDVEVLRPLTRDRPAGPPRRAGGRNGRERLASLPSMNVRAMCSICCYFVSACLCWYSSSMSVLVQQFNVCIWAHLCAGLSGNLFSLFTLASACFKLHVQVCPVWQFLVKPIPMKPLSFRTLVPPLLAAPGLSLILHWPQIPCENRHAEVGLKAMIV